MPIELNEPKIIATTQKIVFQSILIHRDTAGQLNAQVTFNVLDENGNLVSNEQLRYSGEEFNQFWSDFNSGTYLYQTLAQQKSINPPENNSMEDDFINVQEQEE